MFSPLHNQKKERPAIAKAFLIKGGTLETRQTKCNQLCEADAFLMYGVYESEDKSEIAVIFGANHEAFDGMTFDRAQEVCGRKELGGEFTTSTFGIEERFGMIELPESRLLSNSFAYSNRLIG